MRRGHSAKYELLSDIQGIISRKYYRSCSCGAQEFFLAGRYDLRVQHVDGRRSCGLKWNPRQSRWSDEGGAKSRVLGNTDLYCTERKEEPRKRR